MVISEKLKEGSMLSIPSVKFVSMESFTVIGLSCTTSKSHERKKGKIGPLFSAFAKRSNEISNRINDNTIGISIYPDNFSGFENYEYLAGYQVRELNEIPEGMITRFFPARQYAVVTHKGNIKGLFDSYAYFHSKWLPSSGYEYDGQYDIQIYDSRFTDHSDSELNIYFPVRPSEKESVQRSQSPIISEVQGVFIPVQDIKRAKEWYSRILGLPINTRDENGFHYSLPVDGIEIILDEMPNWRGKNVEGPPVYQTPAFKLQTRNISETYRYMKEQGVQLVTEIEDNLWFVFQDLDGNMIMICEVTS